MESQEAVNIFATDRDPVIAARNLCDKHVVKMVLETTQILCTVAHLQGVSAPYRPTHEKHPCVLWANSTYGNWLWLSAHGHAILYQYKIRFGKKHKSAGAFFWCLEHPDAFPKTGDLEPFVQAIPEKYRGPDAVEAYRRYYIAEKARFATWRLPASPPDWWPRQEEINYAIR